MLMASTILCPLLAVLFSNASCLSLMPRVLQARIRPSIGDLDPIYFISLLSNGLGWSLYGCFATDQFIFWANAGTFLFNLYYVLVLLTVLSSTTSPESSGTVQRNTERSFMAMASFWMLVGLLCATAFNSFENVRYQITVFVGTLVCTMSILSYIFYALDAWALLRWKSCKSSLRQNTVLSFLGICDSTMWMIYGLSLKLDIYIGLSSCIGMIIRVVHLGCFLKHRGTAVGQQIRRDFQDLLFTPLQTSSSTIPSLQYGRVARGRNSFTINTNTNYCVADGDSGDQVSQRPLKSDVHRNCSTECHPILLQERNPMSSKDTATTTQENLRISWRSTSAIGSVLFGASVESVDINLSADPADDADFAAHHTGEPSSLDVMETRTSRSPSTSSTTRTQRVDSIDRAALFSRISRPLNRSSSVHVVVHEDDDENLSDAEGNETV